MKRKPVILLADIQSFYASVEIADNPKLKGKPVIVSGDPERRSGIILAANPAAKAYGVKTAQTLWEAKQHCPHAIVVQPRMQRYIDVSTKITDILESYTDLVEPFSIDEQFLDVTGSQSLFGDPVTIARKIQKDIWDQTGVYGRVGIGENKILAKIACDCFAKKNKTGIFELNKDNMRETMWKLDVGEMFGVGSRMNDHLFRMGIRTIGDLANYPVERLKKRWGINGQVLWMSANGIDFSPVTTKSLDGQKAIGHGMTLPRDYRTAKEIRVVLLELCEEICHRARNNHLMGLTVSAGCAGANFNFPTGFHRQTTLFNPSNNTIDIFNAAWRLFACFWDREPIRRIHVSLSNLCSDKQLQLTLFADVDKKRKIGYAMDRIKAKYGTMAIMRAVSLTDAGQARERAAKIGGHYK